MKHLMCSKIVGKVFNVVIEEVKFVTPEGFNRKI